MADRINATQAMARQNHRLQRAQALTAALLPEIEDAAGVRIDRRAVHDRLLHILHRNGACWTTDEDRAAMGLDARDDLGWTPSERVKLEQDRINAMQMLAANVVFNSKANDD